VNEFDKSGAYRRKVDTALGKLLQFRRLYPFKTHPEQIDNLEAKDVYNKGKDVTFTSDCSPAWGTGSIDTQGFKDMWKEILTNRYI